jgi:hypothetical protein
MLPEPPPLSLASILVALSLLWCGLGCAVALVWPPPAAPDGEPGSWRVLLRIGLAIADFDLLVATVTFGWVVPAFHRMFQVFGASSILPVPTRILLSLSDALLWLWFLAVPLLLVAPLLTRLAPRAIREDWDWVVVVASGLFLAVFTAVVTLALYLPIFSISSSIGP